MNWLEFKNKLFDLGCFSIHQVYAWRPGFDRNNLVRWTKKGYLVHLRRGWYAFPEYKDTVSGDSIPILSLIVINFKGL